jgi:hypothetical protein
VRRRTLLADNKVLLESHHAGSREVIASARNVPAKRAPDKRGACRTGRMRAQ